MVRQSFLRGALVLVGASITTKLLGMVMQVVVNRQLGAEGFGLFRAISPLFSMIITLSTLALPIALSKVIAEAVAVGDTLKAQRAMKFTHTLVFLLSVILSGLAVLFASSITSRWLDPRAYLPLIFAVIWVPLICSSWVLSGFYNGIQNQTPPAIAWVLETIARVAITIPLVYVAIPHGLQYGAVAVVTGMGLGELASFSYKYWLYRKRDRIVVNTDHPPTEIEPFRRTLSALAEVAVPTTFKHILGTLAYAAEPIVLYAAFAAVGVSKGTATSLYGSIGMAVQLLLLPTVLSSSLSSVLVPAVSEAAALNNSQLISRRLYQIMRVTFLIGLPATIFFWLLGGDVAVSLYKDPLAGALLSFIAPTCIFIYLREPLSSILQGLNKATLSTVISLTSSVIRIACIYYFVRHSQSGAYGVAKATAITAVISTFLHLFFVQKYVKVYVNWPDLSKIITATALFTLVLVQLKVNLVAAAPVTRLILGILIGGILYTLSLFILKVLRASQLERIPKIGSGLARIVRWIPLFR